MDGSLTIAEALREALVRSTAVRVQIIRCSIALARRPGPWGQGAQWLAHPCGHRGARGQHAAAGGNRDDCLNKRELKTKTPPAPGTGRDGAFTSTTTTRKGTAPLRPCRAGCRSTKCKSFIRPPRAGCKPRI